jgi:hypothetical protein
MPLPDIAPDGPLDQNKVNLISILPILPPND